MASGGEARGHCAVPIISALIPKRRRGAMRQVTQNLSDGKVRVVDVPEPALGPMVFLSASRGHS